MNRAPCLFACINLTNLLDQLPARFTYTSLNDGFMLTHDTSGEVFIVKLATGLALDGMNGAWLWEICLALPHTCTATLSFDKIGVRVHRALRRVAIAAAQQAGANQPQVAGPWSCKLFVETFPIASESIPLLYDPDGHIQSPLVALGDEPRFCGEVDYRPSDADATADTAVDVQQLYDAALAAING